MDQLRNIKKNNTRGSLSVIRGSFKRNLIWKFDRDLNQHLQLKGPFTFKRYILTER